MERGRGLLECENAGLVCSQAEICRTDAITLVVLFRAPWREEVTSNSDAPRPSDSISADFVTPEAALDPHTGVPGQDQTTGTPESAPESMQKGAAG